MDRISAQVAGLADRSQERRVTAALPFESGDVGDGAALVSAVSVSFLSRPSLRERAAAFGCILGFIVVPGAFSGTTNQVSSPQKPWRPPRSCVFTRNPIHATRSSIALGKKIYMMRCVGCHGEHGHGDGSDAGQLRVPPAVLSSAAVLQQTDGALWWKITWGRRPMPAYGFRLSMRDRWHLVNYLRTLRDE